MGDINNPKNIIGMGNILLDDGDDINIDEIENSIMNGSAVLKKREDNNVDLAKEYSKEIEELSRKFNLPNDNAINSDLFDDTEPKKQTNEFKAPYNLVDDDYEDNIVSRNNPQTWAPAQPQDEQLYRMTNEERKQDRVNKVLGSIERNNDDADFIQQEDEEDEMVRIMEQIDLLRTGLEQEGIDLSRIPEVTTNMSKKEAVAVLKILRIKNDRLRYNDFFEEGILAIAYALENAFDGKNEIFGTKIDLTGYSDTVKVKLRRMRYDTSNFVSGIMQGYNINSGWRIMLELIPSLVLYSRDRRYSGKDNLISDESYKKAMQDLQ